MTKPNKKFDKYVDATGEYSNRQLKLSEWYLKHKILLAKIGTIILIAWCVVTMTFGLWKWGEYIIFGYSADKQLYAQQTIEFTNYEELHVLYGAKELGISGVRVFRSGPDQYDLVAAVENSNVRWHATVTYHFSFGGEDTPQQDVIILPNTTQPIVRFGHATTQFPRNIQFVVDNVSWRRINPHSMPDVAGFIAERRQFTASDFDFKRAAGSSSAIPEIGFSVKNSSAYSYWRPVFYVELLNNRVPVGVLFLSIPEFMAGQTRDISLRYFGDSLSVTDIQLSPIVDVFDSDVFINPGD
jgi:hypothetical protein